MKPHSSLASRLVFLTLSLLAAFLAQAGEETRWYLVEFKGGERLEARFIAEEKEFYIFNFQGAPLVVAKGGVLKIDPLSGPGVASSAAAPGPSSALKSPGPGEGSGKGPPPPAAEKTGQGEDPEKKADRRNRLSDDEIRDTIETLGSTEDGAVAGAYKRLSGSFAAARPFLHEAVRHQVPRVRALALKLLGERGTAEEDLKAVASRLSDEKGSVRLAAAMAVRALGPKGFQELIQYLQEEREPNLRKMAIKTLQHWQDPRAIAPLVDLLERETDGGVKGFLSVALEALTRQKHGQDAKAWRSYLSRERLDEGLLERMEEARQEEEREKESGAESAEE